MTATGSAGRFRHWTTFLQPPTATRLLPGLRHLLRTDDRHGLLHFQHAKADFAVIETGLGGRLDATSVMHPRDRHHHISLEHTEQLGNTLESSRMKNWASPPGCPRRHRLPGCGFVRPFRKTLQDHSPGSVCQAAIPGVSNGDPLPHLGVESPTGRRRNLQILIRPVPN